MKFIEDEVHVTLGKFTKEIAENYSSTDITIKQDLKGRENGYRTISFKMYDIVKIEIEEHILSEKEKVEVSINGKDVTEAFSEKKTKLIVKVIINKETQKTLIVENEENMTSAKEFLDEVLEKVTELKDLIIRSAKIF